MEFPNLDFFKKKLGLLMTIGLYFVGKARTNLHQTAAFTGFREGQKVETYNQKFPFESNRRIVVYSFSVKFFLIAI